MSTAIFSAIEAGFIYAIMALGVYLSFRILDFPDLTVDGSFVTGAAVASVLIINGTNPFLASAAALLVGFAAGSITGILHTKGKINPLLSGILMMIALYSINLRIMGRSNVPLLQQDTVMTAMTEAWQNAGLDKAINSMISFAGFVPRTWAIFVTMAFVAIVIKLLLDQLLKTEIGLALRATGDNKQMVSSFSANTDWLTIFGLGLSNALVAFSGALVAQYGGFSDVGMGIGMIVIGLASVIIGEALFGARTIARATLAVIGGAIVYRIILALALRVQFLETGDVKLITAVIVIVALIVPNIVAAQKEKRSKKRKTQAQERGERVAEAQTDYKSI
ncbi:ABC transporter permease [Geobacillus sp. NFOSA3]|uniref:ABC transporter permease n=1 Tax=Parageobacillus galactosidasius TaxID=883812 RepID=A0A226QR48_9BACL|nr:MULTISPECIES: ABC transporter permease [Parageobacillus]NNU93909.1 ABC transporter permease [Geobacillus sp. NFOSA3]OQP01917.1 ABC transporter permease [Geobacillus sp. 44C]MED4990235.1 ABC transporter permease [Parageobacillus toebii]OXB94060.1 ABC transporter permease [Parageobacillus galactosidasius]QNU33621.1 ABC transporter permease [Geobacillus sp. 44C]